MIRLADLDALFAEWNGTPYRDTGTTKQGIDCLRFACMVLDWLHEKPSWPDLSEVPMLPSQTSQHSPRLTMSVVKWVEKRYPHDVVWNRHSGDVPDIRAGDVLVVKNRLLPGHVLVAGTDRSVWHSMNELSLPNGGCVCKTSLGWCMTTGLLKVWRPTSIAWEEEPRLYSRHRSSSRSYSPSALRS